MRAKKKKCLIHIWMSGWLIGIKETTLNSIWSTNITSSCCREVKLCQAKIWEQVLLLTKVLIKRLYKSQLRHTTSFKAWTWRRILLARNSEKRQSTSVEKDRPVLESNTCQISLTACKMEPNSNFLQKWAGRKRRIIENMTTKFITYLRMGKTRLNTMQPATTLTPS